MKRRIALSFALALSVISLALVSFDSAARAQQRQRCTADTGVITLRPNQKLRLATNGTIGPQAGDATVVVGFRRMDYVHEGCNSDGVCKLAVASQSTSAPITVMPGEAAYIDVAPAYPGGGVRVVVLSNRRNVRATAAIIDTVTGEPTSTSLLETMQEDECGL